MAKATTKKALPTSDKKGVSFRKDGGSRWQVRIRKMVNGTNYELPIEYYSVDADAPKGSDTHIDTAKDDAERRAHVLWGQLEKQMLTWSDAPHHYTLRGVLERYLSDINEGRITTKALIERRKAQGLPTVPNVFIRASVHKELSAISVLLGTSKQGKNTGGFPDITEKWMHELAFKDFYDKSNTKAFNHQLKGRDGEQAPNGSVKRLLSALRTIINHANSEWGVPVNNPLKSLKGISVNDKRERVVKKGEWTAMIKQLESTRTDRTTIEAIRFARYSAARRAEVCKLDWTDIDIDDKTATFRETKSKQGKEESRTAPLNKEAMDLIKRLLGNRDIETLSGPVFLTSRAKRLRPDTITQAWSRARQDIFKDTGNEKILSARIHDLRHTRITELGQLLTAAEAARVSGHKDFSTFFRYFNPNPVEIGRKIDAYEAGLGLPQDQEDLINRLMQLSFEDLMAVSMTAQSRKIAAQNSKRKSK